MGTIQTSLSPRRRIARMITAALAICASSQAAIHTHFEPFGMHYTLLDPARIPPTSGRVLMLTPMAVRGTPKVAAPLGVWLTAPGGNWAIYAQDRTPLPYGAMFSVGSFDADKNHFVVTASPNNVSRGMLYIDSVATNNRPSAVIQVVAEFSPTADFDGYNRAFLAVYYDALQRKWAIFNQNNAPIPQGLRVHVVVDTAAPPGYAWAQGLTRAGFPFAGEVSQVALEWLGVDGREFYV